jgi:AraC-like DNA-binding protein
MTNSATVAEIAQRWGFSDLSSFSRAFRQEFGKTATDVRVESRLADAD